MSHHTAFTMAALCVAGGVAGYVRKGSRPSLIAGVLIGGSFAASGYLIQENMNYGHELAAVTSAVLATAMGRRALASRKPMPSVLALVGLAGLWYNGNKAYEFRYGI